MAPSEVTREPLERISVLSHRLPVFGDDGLSMQEAAHLGKLILRVDATIGKELFTQLSKGARLPTEPCSTAFYGNGAISILWLGPDEWMLVTEKDAESRVKAQLSKALTGQHFQLSNVTDYYSCIDISGCQTREILMNLTTLDMHARGFAAGQVKGSNFGHANAHVWQLHTDTGAPETFRLIIRASMADYLWCLITRSARLFGMREEKPAGGERLVV
uniref:sarcosine oxidase subunit gamma n=1 Tax=Pararhizobium sp. IMCC3301 TaxID=3067904 RepID=UPI00274134D1|nr:sarcosine oxidase subunit gamma family protein [Pararhizobium sp. IMCC3301]